MCSVFIHKIHVSYIGADPLQLNTPLLVLRENNL